jgi:F-type H+-transporting ATPase subunit b
LPHIALQGLILAADAAGGTPPGSILSFDRSLLVHIGIMTFNILLLTAVLVFLLYKPVKKFMAERTERIRHEIETARAEREDALEMKEKYERLIAEIEMERDDVLLQAHKKAMDRSDQLLFEARREADAMFERAMDEIETERKNVADDMKKQVVEISAMMAGRFIEVSIDRETQDRYIETAFDDWEGS